MTVVGSRRGQSFAGTCLGGGFAPKLPPLAQKTAPKTREESWYEPAVAFALEAPRLELIAVEGTLCLWLVAPNLTGEHWRGACSQWTAVSKRSSTPTKFEPATALCWAAGVQDLASILGPTPSNTAGRTATCELPASWMADFEYQFSLVPP
jgi:hypothetical protein